MYLLQADETNSEPNQGDFFIYGGLALPVSRLRDVHDAVAAVRSRYGFADEDQFKFHTRTRPAGMSIETWTDAKKEVLARAAGLDVDLMIYVVHHGIAGGVSVQDRNRYALNALIAHFDMRYLVDKAAYGAVTIDRLEEGFGYTYLRDRFQKPLELPNERTPKLLRVLHYSMTCDGASHLSSLVDIAIGAMRYCVNAASGRGNQAIAESLFPAVCNLLWKKQEGEDHRIGGYGFIRYPKVVKAYTYQLQYESLTQTLTRYANAGG